MNISLFGGAFDPPHNGHITIASALLNLQYADEVWFLPVGNHAFNKNMSSPEHRIAMLRLILQDNMLIEMFELRQQTTNYTFQTLEALSVLHPEHTFSFVIGSDNLGTFDKWQQHTSLLKKYTVRVYPRKHFALQPLHENMVVLENVKEIEVSSTLVREKLKKGESISQLVPEDVAEYIQLHRLYTE